MKKGGMHEFNPSKNLSEIIENYRENRTFLWKSHIFCAIFVKMCDFRENRTFWKSPNLKISHFENLTLCEDNDQRKIVTINLRDSSSDSSFNGRLRQTNVLIFQVSVREKYRSSFWSLYSSLLLLLLVYQSIGLIKIALLMASLVWLIKDFCLLYLPSYVFRAAAVRRSLLCGKKG